MICKRLKRARLVDPETEDAENVWWTGKALKKTERVSAELLQIISTVSIQDGQSDAAYRVLCRCTQQDVAVETVATPGAHIQRLGGSGGSA
jgi:hypothetical protein